MSIRVGIIGCGGVANSHLKGYQAHGIPVAAVADVSMDAANAFAEKVDGDVKCFDNFKALLDAGVVDAISVCSPPAFHEEAAVEALKRGIHVLCEKPLAHNVASGQRIANAVAASEALFMPAFRHRFLPAILRMRDIVASGEIGEPVFFQNVFAGPNPGMKDRWFANKDLAGGGVLMDTCPHSVDLFRFLLGEVAEQKALFHAHFEGTGVEDAGSIALRAESGAVGSLGASWVAGASQAFVTIVGRNGMVSYNYLNNKELHVQVNKEPRVEEVQPSTGFPEEIEHFREVIRNGTNPVCTVHDALRALEIIQAVY